VHVGVDNES